MAKRKTIKHCYEGGYKSEVNVKKLTKALNEERFGNQGTKEKRSSKDIDKDFFNKQQKHQLSLYIKKYSRLTNDILKELLVKNRQLKTGTRKELLERCSEMKLLGSLRNCPKCKEILLNFNSRTGEYFCKGYKNGMGDFIECNFKSFFVERIPWIED